MSAVSATSGKSAPENPICGMTARSRSKSAPVIPASNQAPTRRRRHKNTNAHALKPAPMNADITVREITGTSSDMVSYRSPWYMKPHAMASQTREKTKHRAAITSNTFRRQFRFGVNSEYPLSSFLAHFTIL